jgi:predicted nucleotidyltransferase
VDSVLPQVVGRIVRANDPDRIILFGSRARGDQRPDSDFDLLVVLDAVENRREARIAVRRSFVDLPISADVLVATVDEVDGRIPGRPTGAVFWAVQEGQTIYDRGDRR